MASAGSIWRTTSTVIFSIVEGPGRRGGSLAVLKLAGEPGSSPRPVGKTHLMASFPSTWTNNPFSPPEHLHGWSLAAS